MTPDELEELSKIESDIRLSKERRLGLCSKLNYFFFEQVYPSNLDMYLQLKKSGGAHSDYSAIDNESVLRGYGIEIPA